MQQPSPGPVLSDGSRILALFVLEGQRYALDVSVVERVLPMAAISPLPRAPAIALGVVNLAGAPVPVLDVRRRFGIASRDYGLDGHLLVARTRRRLLALQVDEVLGTTEVTAAAVVPPRSVLPGIEYVAGIAALPDGLLFIHDLDAFLSLDEDLSLGSALGEGGP